MKFDSTKEYRVHCNCQTYPNKEELNTLKTGDHVKIQTQKERFWVLITEVGETIKGIIDNDLFNTKFHGLKCGDTVEFERKNIFKILNEKYFKELKQLL